MIVLLFVVCVASLLFFAVFLFQISHPRRTPRKEPVVRKVSTSEAVEPAAGRKWLIHLEQMAEFLRQNKTTAILLVVLAISSASLVAQEQGGPPPNSDEQQPRQMAQQSSDPISAPAMQPADQQQTAGQSSPPAPSPLPTPAITGPLQAAPPITFEGGPFGKLNLDGVVSGIGLWQGNHVPGDNTTQAALSNGQVFIQKTTSWWQFYV
ncbi:MAG TPA: hypothetical protein VFC29_06255, partial [Candidatus Limnocylindrales bacterium]|nr:hypothetical protein [Candidatus Limnocylindrales bacterium]